MVMTAPRRFVDLGLRLQKAAAANPQRFAEKLTKRDGSGNVTQWGLQIPSSGFPYWLFQALAIENGEELMNRQGDQTFYAKPAVVEALQYWVDLGRKQLLAIATGSSIVALGLP